jgi:hypothetical protein
MKYIKDRVEFINEAKKSKKLNEGQFSWLTQDTGKQIGSERQNTIDVYMYDDKGNKFKERKYDGYGNFGGKDYYDLLANMNGYLDTDVDKMSQRDLRNVGIDLAFGKLKTKDPKKKVLFPALVEDPRFNWKKHDFTDQPESDPDQSWYQEDESWDDEDNDGYSYESATNEANSDKAVSMAQKKLDKVMTDLKANLLKFKGANSDKEKETFKSEAGRLTKLRKDAHNNLEQAIQDAYADVELIVIENYDSDQRKDMAAKGLALPDGSFPIKTLEDLKNAIQAYGRAKDHAKAAKFIAKRAKVLGAEDLIPDTEDFQKALKEASFGEIPKFGK